MSTTATTSSAPAETTLRRRFRVLEKAQSTLSTPKGSRSSDLPKILPLEMKHSNDGGEAITSSPTEYDSHSDSSEEGEERVSAEDGEELGEEEVGEDDDELPFKAYDKQAGMGSPTRPSLDTLNLGRHGSHRDRSSPMSPKSRAWYEFDLAVVVALVSPIGNLLTGGDHIKNLLLLVLLIFYLHQIIEVPWRLYQKARPRNRAFHMPPVDPDSSEGRYAALAASELQKWELFYLLLAFLSPMVGASLLRYSTAAILGNDAVSWFSTGLFVLATGMRPWAHLVDRLNERTEELHDFVHYPSPTRTASEDQHNHLQARVAQLEKSLSKVKSKLAHSTEDLYEYMDDAMDAVEHAMKKQERRWDKCEGKVKEVEQVVVQIRSAGKPHHTITFDFTAVKAYIRTILEHIFPAWLFNGRRRHSPPSIKLPPRSHAALSSSSTCSTPLETIVEEDYGFEPTDKMPILARPYSITSAMVHKVGDIVIMPLRAAARMVIGKY